MVELNKNKESEVCYYIYDIINYLIESDKLKLTDFNQQMAKYFIEIENITTDKFFRNVVGDENLNTVNEILKSTDDVQEVEVVEEGYDMMDNDNDEDDMMESEMS